MTYCWVESWTDFEKIGSEWDQLLAGSNANCVFLSWDWVRTCCTAVKWQLKPLILIVRSDTGDLLGIAPFYVTTYQLLKGIRVTILRLLPDVINGSLYIDFVVDRRYEFEVYRLICIRRRRTREIKAF